MASGTDGDVGLRLRLFGRQQVRRDLQDTQGDLADTGTAGQKAARGIASIGDKGVVAAFGGVQKGLKGLAGGAAAAGLAVGAAFVGSLREAIDQQGAGRNVQAALGLDPAASAAAGAEAGKLYAQNYGESRAAVAEALVSVSRNTGVALGTADLETMTKAALNLASTFDVDVAQAARAAGQLVKTGLARNSTEAFDVITKGFQSGANASDDYLDTLTEYPTTLRALGLDATQFTGLLSQGLQAGALSGDVVADALKEVGNIIGGGGDSVTAALQDLGLNADETYAAFAKGGDAAGDATQKILDGLRKTQAEGKATRNDVSTLFGGPGEDLGAALFALNLNTASDAMGDVSGAASNLDTAVNSGVIPAFESVGRSVLGFLASAGTPLLDRWGPDAIDVMTRVSNGVNTLAQDVPALSANLQSLVRDGNIGALGPQLDAAFALPPGTVERLQVPLDGIVAKGGEIATVLGSAFDALRSIPISPLNLANDALGWAATHTQAFKTGLIVLASVYGAAKVAALGYAAVQLISNVRTAIGTGLMAANNAVYAASRTYIATWIGVKGLELGAWIRSSAATAASTIALGANRVAYGVSYLMTWLAIKGLELAAWARSTAATALSTGVALANRAAYGVSYLATFIAVKGLELGAWLRSTAATGASTVAMLASAAASAVVRGATIAWTAGQWLLNAALTANPIGLVVAGIALLVGGIVLAYNKSDTFRGIVQGLWGGIKNLASVVWDFAKNAGAKLVDFAQAGRDKFVAIKDAVGGFVDKVKDGITWVTKLADKLSGGLIGKALGAVGVNIDGAAADGGPIRQGQTFLVGEEGPELFTAGLSGKILPSQALAQLMSTPVPSARMTSTPTLDYDDDDSDVTDGLASIDLTVHVDVDGRTLATATVNGLHENAAWT